MAHASTDLSSNTNQRYPSGKHHKANGKGPKRGAPNQEPTSATRTGIETTIKWYNDPNGYGFAYDPDSDKDIFIHRSVAKRVRISSLIPGAEVVLDCRIGKRGFEATNIRLK